MASKSGRLAPRKKTYKASSVDAPPETQTSSHSTNWSRIIIAVILLIGVVIVSLIWKFSWEQIKELGKWLVVYCTGVGSLPVLKVICDYTNNELMK